AMIVGADENAIVTQSRINVATHQTDHTIEFWGRYFKESGNTSPEQYQPTKEAALLNQKNIRVLPIGRQTGHVAGSESLGRTETEGRAQSAKKASPETEDGAHRAEEARHEIEDETHRAEKRIASE